MTAPGFPLAVQGVGCHLPDAPDAAAFWRNLRAGRTSVRDATAADWFTDPAPLLRTERGAPDHITSASLAAAPPLSGPWSGLPRDLGWPLAAARQALDDAGPGASAGCGLILGHYAWAATPATLAIASALTEAALDAGLGPVAPPRPAALRAADADPALADLSDGLVRRIASTLGLDGPAYALDAACATFPYALRLAALHLAAGEADRMLVVAANAGDSLFLAHSLSVVQALPAGGRSWPLVEGSDGMTVGEGAVAVLVGRSVPGPARDRPAWGTIRGIGLSNDGRGQGLTAPNPAGQRLACERCFAEAGLDPRTIDFVECHATGTKLGDRAELDLVAKLFAGATTPPLGAAKANVGHLMTASGGVGLLKVLLAMRAGEVPPAVGPDGPGGPPRPWPEHAGRRRAAVNAFGFGGTNAHLVVDQAPGADGAPEDNPEPAPLPPATDLAITGLAGCFGPWEGLPDLARAFHAGESGRRPLPSQRWRGLDGDGALLARLGLDTGRAPEGGYLSGFAADPLRLRIPPRDLGRINPQHTLMLHVGDAALRDAGIRPGSRVAVLVAMAMENDVHRLAARWSVGRLLPGAPDAVQAAVRDALHPPPEAGDCLGHVGNLIASRIAALWDLSGPAMTVSAGPAGVARALDLARHLLAAGEAEAVLVGAVDLAGGLGNLAVRLASHPEDGRAIPPGEGAGAVVLRPDAPGLSSYAVLPRGGAGGPTGLTEPVDQAADAGTVELLGACGAAGGIAGVIRAALAVANRALPEGAAPRQPWLAPSGAAAASVVIRNRDGVRREVIMRERGRGALPRRADPVGPPFVLPVPARDGPALAAALASVARRLEDGEPAPCLEAEATAGDDGSLPYAACLVGRDAAALAAEARHLMNRAEACLDKGQTQLAPGGSVLCGSPIGPAGRVAFVFPGFDSAYPGLCRDLPLLADGVVEDLARRFAEPARLLPPELLFGRADTPEKAEQAADRLQRAGEWHLQLGPAVAFIGMRVLEERLGLQPDLCFGHSLGELSMLFATGAWTFDQDWLGRLASLRPVLGRLALPAGHGRFLVVAPASDVRAALGSHAELALSNSTRECVVVGPEEACAAALERLGLEWLRLADGFAAHTAAAAALAPALAEHLDAPLACRPGVRFLFGQGEPEADRWTSGDVAARIAAGLSRPFDFAGLVERAHAEGARLFIEVGPGSGCTRWIGDTLGAARRPHLAAPLTRRGVDEPVALAQLAAALVAHRRPVDFANLLRRPTPPPPQAMRVTTGGPSVLAALRSVVPHAAEPPAPVACAAAPRAPAPLPVRPLPAARATGSCVLELAAEQHSWGHLVFLQQRRTLVEALALGGRQAAVVAPAPAASLPPAPKPARVTARTPLLEEAAILELAEGRAHAVFGPDFLPVDAMPRRIRVPGQPFTALTRVLALEGTRGRFDHGRIVTEYDIPDRAWFAVDGISASEIAVDGQGVLILLAWLGADFESRGQRRFRWLDATATVLGAPPREGETVRYDIRLEHSFRDGDNLILQFRNEASVDGRPLLAITDCMVGLFQDAALAASAGILSQHRIARHPGPAFAPPLAPPHGGRLDRAGLLALSAGGPGAAFSPAHAAPHAPALRLPAPPLHMLDEVTAIRTAGGRLGLGGAEAALTLDPTHWAVRAHFKDDPVFPGPCMLEGATQLLKIQALASGLQRGAVPGAHFVPLRGRPRRMRFRAQAVPSGQTFTYRSETVAAGMSPEPFIVADVEFDVEGRTIGRVEDLGLTMTAAVR